MVRPTHTAKKSTNEVAKGQDRHMHDLPLLDKLRAGAVVIVVPESLGLRSGT